MKHCMLLLVVSVIVVFHGTHSTHFIGGTLYWRYEGSGRNIILVYFLNTYGSDTGIDGGTGFELYVDGSVLQEGNNPTLTLKQAAKSEGLTWTANKGSNTITNTEVGLDRISYFGVTGVELYDPTSNSWQLTTYLDLADRPDTGQINNSPVVLGIPFIVAENGCAYTIRIPVFDPDGDIIKCRLATGSKECGDVCDTRVPETSLDSTSCTLTFDTNSAFVANYAMMIQVEDYISSTSLTPLSSVPFQFVVQVRETLLNCNSGPVFVSPTPEEGSCIPLKVGEMFTLNINATTTGGATITEIPSIGPSALSGSGSTLGSSSRTLQWTPSAADSGLHLLCFQAIDSNSTGSEQRCVNLNVGGVTVTATSPMGAVPIDHSTWTITFDAEFQSPSSNQFIKIYDNASVLQEIIDISNGTNFVIGSDNLSATFETTFEKKAETLYTVYLPPTLIFGTGGCGKQQLSNWTFIVKDCGWPVASANSVVQSDTNDTTFGANFTNECILGHEKTSGAGTIKCNENGNWNEGATCTIKDCGFPVASVDSIVQSDTNDTTFGAMFTNECISGHEKTSGSGTIKCNENGNWTEGATCTIKESELGESCLDDSLCAVEGSACIDSTCVCPTGVYERNVNKCDTMPLFSYGPQVGDLNLPYSDDECNTSVKLTKIWIPIRGSIKRKFFICANGLISFNGTYTNASPQRNRFRPGNRCLIAPFHADAILASTSRIYYRWADVTNAPILLSNGTTFAQSLVRTVHRNNFTAKFVLFVTWLDVQPSISTDRIYERSTFQLVLLSDGVNTYVMYVYGHNKMNWKPKDKPNIWIGYNIGDHMETNMNSFQRDVYNIDKNATTGGIRGLLLYKLTPDGIGPTNYAIKCLDWFDANKNKQSNNNNQLQQMPQCPCSLDRLVFDPWFTAPERGRYSNTTCVHMWAARIHRPHGKTCCYDTETKLWIQQYPRAGGYQEYHPTLRPREHQLYDVNTKKWCCDKSDLCEMYYLINPVGDCYRETWFQFGTLWGDPHFKTLDGKTFTFNGLGEYTLLNSPNFTLQARTERALRDCVNCSLSFATIFSAFAARDVDNGSIHVELNKAKTGINVYGNDVDISTLYTNSSTDDYRPFTFQAEQGNLIITKRNGTLMALFPTSGISLNVSIGVQMLTVKVIIPKSYRGHITGLLGNFDGFPDNDFILPNKTMLPANMTEKQIFRYASKWSVGDNTSVFKYPAGFSHSDFSNASYIPMFLEDANASVIEEAIRECGSEESISCIFDLIFTENKEVADDSRQTNDTAIATQKDVENETPSISGCERLQIEPGKTATCFVTFTDDDTKLDIVFLSNNKGAKREKHVLNATLGQIDYEPINLEPTELSVTVVDERGTRAVPVVVSIEACTGCSDRGVCSTRVYQENRGNRHFRFQQCICEQYYEGQDCEEDFDGCATEPCSHGRNCTDLSSLQHERTGQAFTCSPCKDVGGYVEDGDKCKDVNECETHDGGCEQICLNSEGSFDCSCKTGYRRSSTSFSQCEDINECNEALHDCQQICINTNGTFTCDCLDGFSYNVTKNICTQVFDPCQDIGLDCSQTEGCTNTSGTPQCVCFLGNELLGNNTCRDIDECTQNVCQQNCTNKDGGFKCSCWVGYKPSLTDSNACEGCEFPFWGESCTGICRCDGSGSSQCSPISGCVCNSGWTGESCQADIDECEETPSICEDPYKRCINTIGSFSCDCVQGFQPTDTSDPTSNCQDIDDCETPELNNCLQYCANGIGGYTCECYDGFYLNGSDCMDIDECQISTSGCQQICDNKPGTFNCYCHFGYLLNDDRKTCERAKDPCASFSDLHCKDICLANDTHAWCVCNKGFKLAQDKESCIEIDECDNNVTNLCDDKDLCVNIAGSFTCSCKEGWKLENDGRACKTCDEYHFGYNCNSRCECAIGAERCDPVQGCICWEGWTGNQCEVDRDECSTRDSLCTSQHSHCTNTPGSYRCECMPGYQNTTSANTCTDIDECADLSVKCDQICHNTPGSYSCSCREGFIMKNNLCQDIDECAGVNDCWYNCANTIGGYRCTCPEGFKLALTDRRSCIPISQCPDDNITTCHEGNAECYMAKDSPTCKCKKGFQSDVSPPESCIDVDECTGTLGPCEQLCQNNKGGYRCDCREGYSLDVDGTSCRQCQEGTYGKNCSRECSCTTAKTASCDPVTGKCSCLAGWSGYDCNDDLDECRSSSLFTCPDNSACFNVYGSYTCQCTIGYFKTGDELCKPCEDIYYGPGCANVCTCNTNTTALCGNVDGSCTCKAGWEGNTCNGDINECETSAKDVTCNDDRLECINIAGSFQCDCKEGFYKLDGKCTVYIAVTIVLELSSEISLDLISDYQNIKAKLEIMFQKVYRNSIAVIGIRSGLVVDYRVPVEYKNVTTEMDITITTLMMVKGDVALQYDGSSVMALNATVDGYNIKKDTSVCDVYILVVGPCDEGETCTTENEQPVCRKPKTDGQPAFLIWISVGSVVFIVVMVILICVVIRMRKTRRRRNGGCQDRSRYSNEVERKDFEEMPTENSPGPSWLSTSSHVPSNRNKIEKQDYQLSAFPVDTRRKHGLSRYNVK